MLGRLTLFLFPPRGAALRFLKELSVRQPSSLSLDALRHRHYRQVHPSRTSLRRPSRIQSGLPA